MRKDTIGPLRTVALLVERARTVVVILAIFALCALTFQVVLAEKLSVCDSSPTARRTSTFSVGFAAFTAT